MFQRNLDWNGIGIVILSTLTGLATSLVLRHHTVVAKEYANFADLCLVTLGAHFWLDRPIRPTLFIAVILVSISLYLYNVTSSSSSSAKPIQVLPIMTVTTSYILPNKYSGEMDNEIELETVETPVSESPADHLHRRDPSDNQGSNI